MIQNASNILRPLTVPVILFVYFIIYGFYKLSFFNFYFASIC